MEELSVILAAFLIGGIALNERGHIYVDGGYCDNDYPAGYLVKSSRNGWATIKACLVCPMGVAVNAAGSVYLGDAGQVYKLRP